MSKSELKKVNIPTGSQAEAEDIWSTGEQDALHIPILGAEAEQSIEESACKPDLLNPFGVYVSKEATNEDVMLSDVEANEEALFEDEILLDEALLEDEPSALEDSSSINDELGDELLHASIPSPVVEESGEYVIGVYASSELYVKSISKELSQYTDSQIHCFDASMTEAQLQSDEAINMWIVNLSDDDESELLDTILEQSSEYPSLYLSGSLSKHCKNSIHAFLKENNIN